MTQLKINLVVEKLAREKITEWKHEGILKRQKNSFWKKTKPLLSTSSINTAEQPFEIICD